MPMSRRLSALVPLALVAAAASRPAAATEEAPFAVVARSGACELRDYPARVVAETRVSGDMREASYGGFRILARYIFGANAPRSVSTEVRAAPRGGAQIAMTAPVAETPDGDGWVIQFVMPRAYTLGDLPKPLDPRIRLRVEPARRVMAIRFSGYARSGLVADRSRDLEACLRARSMTAAGPVALAQYDPPWTLGPFRRNDLLAPVAR